MTPPESFIVRPQKMLILQLKTAVKVMDGSSIRVEVYRAVSVPFQEQLPKARVISPKEAERVHSLIVAEPASIPAAGFIAGCKDSLIFAMKAAQILIDTELNQWSPFSVCQLSEPFRFISCNSKVFHNISTAPCGGAIGKPSCFEFGTPASFSVDRHRKPVYSRF